MDGDILSCLWATSTASMLDQHHPEGMSGKPPRSFGWDDALTGRPGQFSVVPVRRGHPPRKTKMNKAGEAIQQLS
jgi:hypothetical protein